MNTIRKIARTTRVRKQPGRLVSGFVAIKLGSGGAAPTPLNPKAKNGK
jgi:hypothetical protein